MGKHLNLSYTSSLEKMVSINSSFDAGVLRVCYHGKNRNRSEITKDIFEKCIPTIYNCPIVCNYIREDDQIGAHDVEVVKTSKGLKLVNVTTPVGVVPTGANYWWEKVEEENGVVHEYLCVEVLIWKRQEAYEKLKEDGITSESMEITVKDGEMVDGYYRVYDFEFTAFCLLGTAEPCFESASVRLFEKDEFASMYSSMMSDLKDEISKAQPTLAHDVVDILHPQNYSEGGNGILDKKIELMAKYGFTVEMLDFNIEDFEVEELESKFEALKEEIESSNNDDAVDDDTVDDNIVDDNITDDNTDTADVDTDLNSDGINNFSLTGEQFRAELIEVLSTVKTLSSWGEEINKYYYMDYDPELSEVYCYDYEDWKIYGFSYSVDGDAISIDFETKTRKKVSIVDFEDGDDGLTYTHMYESISAIGKGEVGAKVAVEKADFEEKYSQALKTIGEQDIELNSLRKFKEDVLDNEREEAETAVFSTFEDLDGMEAFETLKKNSKDYSIEDLEEKCFALRGRKTSKLSFNSQNNRAPKLPVTTQDNNNEPYGGLFIKYNSHK